MASIFSQLRRVFSTEPAKKETFKEKTPVKPKRVKFKKEERLLLEKRGEAIIRQAKEEALKLRGKAEAEARRIGQEVSGLKERLISQEAEIGRRKGVLEERERTIGGQKRQLDQKFAEIEKIKKEQVSKLEKIASLAKEEAKKLVIDRVEKDLAEEVSRRIDEAEEEIKSCSEEKAKEVLIEAMQRGVTDYVVEYTVSNLKLPDEEMKGRIIGREGRNIRAFERATGVEIELDETNDVYLSSFDPVRREIARRSLEKLIKDRRIRPSRIEEIVQKTRQEMDKVLVEEGRKLCRQAGVYRLHPDLVKLLGKYKFRFSYGQNLGIHTLEVVKIGLAIAGDLKADVNVVRLGGLLHDIGKIVTEEEGTHVSLGVDLAKKYHLPRKVIACIAEHHEDKAFSSVESRIIWVADAISGARPGARYEPHGEYVKRMTEIEEAASGFKGVTAAYAYQAGREVRVLVRPESVSDKELPLLAYKIKKQLEDKVAYVGQVKVTCIRENRFIETTKAK